MDNYLFRRFRKPLRPWSPPSHTNEDLAEEPAIHGVVQDDIDDVEEDEK